MDSASHVWLAGCTLLMFVLLAGLALLQMGSARAKNAVHGLVQLMLGLGVVSLVFWALGHSMAFGPSAAGWLGTGPAEGDRAQGLGQLHRTLVAVLPLFIVCGAVAERARTVPLLAFAVVMAVLIYPVLAHWTLNPQGWLARLGLVDAAGATAVHALGAWAALAALLVVGPRWGRYGAAGELRRMAPHHAPLAGAGAWLMWLGWFGFVGAQVTTWDNGAVQALGRWLLHTQLGACAGLLAAAAALRATTGRLPLRGMLNGALCALVALCAGASVLSPVGAVVTGAVAGLLCTWASPRVHTLRLDDANDVLCVHGLGAIWGLLAAGLFYAGDAFNGQRLLVQALAVLASFAWGFPLAWGALRLIDRLAGGLRATARDEMRGLDYSEHRTVAYPERGDAIGAIKLDA